MSEKEARRSLDRVDAPTKSLRGDEGRLRHQRRRTSESRLS